MKPKPTNTEKKQKEKKQKKKQLSEALRKNLLRRKEMMKDNVNQSCA